MKRELQKLSSDKEGETSKDHLIAQLQQKPKTPSSIFELALKNLICHNKY